MTFELRQSFQFESARFLPNLPSNHPCSRMHGHSFKLTLIWQGQLDPRTGWVRDYHEVKQQTQITVLNQLDHQVLNQVAGLDNPTSELLAVYIYNQVKTWLPELTQVIIKETPDTECRYPLRFLTK